MRLLIQVVKSASVEIDSKVVASIGQGELIFVGFKQGDNRQIVDKMIAKLIKLRIFSDGEKTNINLTDNGGEMLAVSQFTLYASLNEGNRPAFVNCMNKDEAGKLFAYFQQKLSESFSKVQYGVFHADMKVNLINDGPFTILLDSKELGYE